MKRQPVAFVLTWLLATPLTMSGVEVAQPRAPKLVVLLVVDQMRADYIDKFGHQWSAGLRRLLDGGAWFRQAAYPYLNTITCAGHATIATGTFPATHGMILNQWWDRESGAIVGCTEDAQTRLIGYGSTAAGGGSARRLLVPTFADELRAQATAARIVSLSLKDRSAIMLAGRRADAVTWFQAAARGWVTSSIYATSVVPFISQFVTTHPIETEAGKSWTRSLPAEAYLFDDAAAGERPPGFWTASFPHQIGAAPPDAGFYGAWQTSPFADAYLGRMAQAAVDGLDLGKGRGTDYLAVSFSALDTVGHAFGPRSHEVQDVLVRLDATIGALLDHLDRRVGADRYLVALSADHGVAPIPEQMAQEGLDAGRIVMEDVVKRVETILEPILGPGKHVARMAYTDFYLAPGVADKIAAQPTAMHAVIDAIRGAPGVGRIFWGAHLAERRSTDDSAARAAAASYLPGRSGDLIVVPKPYWFFVSGDPAIQAATTHGTAHPYDTRVPVVLMGPGIKSGEYWSSATPADIAPTLAFLCGITLGRQDGRVLAEALTPSPRRPGPVSSSER